MSRVATRSGNSGKSHRAGAAAHDRGNDRGTGKMASAAALSLAPGTAGWTMPRLDGVATAHKVWRGDRVAALIGSGLLRAGVAGADTWALAEQDPFRFARLSIKHFVDRHGGLSIRETFQMNLALTGTLNECSTGDREIEAANLFLTIDPTEAGYLVLDSTLRILEEQHPRLPATFFHLLCGALNRWVRVYDYRDALEHVERLRDWYSTDPDSEDIEVPDVEGSIPAFMRQQPLSGSGLKRLLPNISGEALVWMERVIELDRLAKRQKHPPLTEQTQEELGDCNAPLPCLLVVFSRRDNIEACFDAEAESMMEVPPEPNLIIPLNATDPDQTRAAFNVLANACETLAAASRLIATLPDSSFK
jgi:hypothetical protein